MVSLINGNCGYVAGVAIVTPSAVGPGLSFILAVIAKTCGREREEEGTGNCGRRKDSGEIGK